ncbi:acyl-CoA dehydrogenase family protein [Streptomyces sp. NPDC097727]|uniref:acyl-CoA dehydrogenase family protein n=1 Tax=Streptomyces sp. NPDC097727 TaxID=3366092 RepID=UPI00380AF390
MQRQIFTREHDAFRETVRTFLTKEVLPHYEQWERDGIVSREAWLAAGRQGLLGLVAPEEYGGGGSTDYRYSAVLAEEFTRAGAPGHVADRCLQLHGGYGYMTEYPVAKAFTDGRIQTIYGGATEIMKEIIGRSLLA